MRSLPDYLSQAVWWLVYNLGGITVPVMVASIVSAGMGYGMTLDAITNGGQFALYSAGVLVSTTFHCIGRPNQRRLRFSEALVLTAVILFAAAIGFFVVAVMSANGASIAPWVTRWPTIGLFVLSLVLAFATMVVDQKRASMNIMDYEDIVDGKQKRLKKDLHRIRKG